MFWQVFFPLCFAFSLWGQNLEESLHLRRIASFCEEGELKLAKDQIEEFLQLYPETESFDFLSATLADLYLNEANYSKALEYYGLVKSEEVLEKIFPNRMHCLYELGWYANMAEECQSRLENASREESLHKTHYYLALALYHQALRAEKGDPLQKSAAEKALPFFASLYDGDMKWEIAKPYSYLCSLAKDYERAAKICGEYAEEHEGEKEDLLFQKALFQLEYDRPSALELMEEIVKAEGEKSKEAAYNWIVSAFEEKRFPEILEKDFFPLVPEKQRDLSSLIKAKCLANLEEAEKALEILQMLSEKKLDLDLHLLILDASIEIAHQSDRLAFLDSAIEKIEGFFQSDPSFLPSLSKALFYRVQALKKKEMLPETRKALKTLLQRFSSFPEKPRALFEMIHLEGKEENWKECHLYAKEFLSLFPDLDLTPFVWRYLLKSLHEIAKEDKSQLLELTQEIQRFLTLYPEEESWKEILAKSYFEIGDYEAALSAIEKQKSANAKLLFALSSQKIAPDASCFCKLGEEAISEGTNLLPHAQIHLALFNSYLELGDEKKGAFHLLKAFERGAFLETENLLWLSDRLFSEIENAKDRQIEIAQSASLIKSCLKRKNLEKSVFIEQSERLAKCYALLGKIDEEIDFLEGLKGEGESLRFLLAKAYLKKGMELKAEELFDEILQSALPIGDFFVASASLESALLKISKKHPEGEKAAKLLKTSIIQKRFENEPLHLEAALEYIDLMSQKDLEKRLRLIEKTQRDFTSEEDLLARDYHAARKKHPEKEPLYQSYLLFLEAWRLSTLFQIDKTKKDLQAKAEDILLEMKKGSLPEPLKRKVELVYSNSVEL